ncbi:acyl-CoA thioesterase [Desulfacinum infernum DSM 9756]|jgi:acyl-CoA thioesterase|uniref:Acyl-CoA thioesterase n=1 Tax=Desulfacinum infernum DSM 9756 TaxID=1121391 RepID=A0A1M4SNE0_9BACT|nr:PaaI family thioesterase [Desulfacinum infernum]SHE33672.1 acyl-CoA thioesterase [Desulfacinum infernum DSM 9756]
MDEAVRRNLLERVEKEPYARHLGLRLVRMDEGYALVEMDFDESKQNIFGMAHGGAIFSLIDEAFEVASNSHGIMAVALNMNVTYMAAPRPGDTLRAEASEVHRTPRTASYQIRVTGSDGTLVALCQALVYRKKDRAILEM